MLFRSSIRRSSCWYIVELHGLESTLVYFATSLRANSTVLDQMCIRDRDIPLKVDGAAEGVYTTIPLGILLTQTTITTVCSVDTPDVYKRQNPGPTD